MNAKEKMIKARAGLVLDAPFFGSLVLRLKTVEDKGVETAWTDGVTLGYNPDFVDGLSLDEMKGVLCHEVMHCACAHQARRGSRQGQKWNQAGDYAINSIVEDAGFALPEGRLRSSAYDGKSADEIYTMLPDPPPGGGKQGTGQGATQDPGGCGEVRDAPGPEGQVASPADMAQTETDWKIAAAQAAQQAKAMGSLPESLKRLIEEIVNPKVDWRELLRRFVQTCVRNDYRWYPPNRRFIHRGLYLPGLRSEEMGEMVLVVDTSGSISPQELSQFAAEITAIIEEYDTELSVVYCDAGVAGVETVHQDDLPLQLTPVGGGGTDFRPPFEWVEQQGKNPTCLIYLTDGCCDRYPPEPSYPVLWVGTQEFAPPFGDFARM